MRKITAEIYIIAAVITLAIFSLGILSGVVIEGKRLAYIESKDSAEKINFESLQVQYLYLSTLNENDACPAFSASLNKYIDQTESIRMRMENYLEGSGVYKDEFLLLKRQYTISQVNYWILAEKTRDMCKTDLVTILYFHSKDCAGCREQGFVLDYFKKMLGNRLLVFSFDANFADEPMIGLLKNTHNVTETPAVIIGDKKFTGFVSKDELKNELCGLYAEKPDMCGELPEEHKENEVNNQTPKEELLNLLTKPSEKN